MDVRNLQKDTVDFLADNMRQYPGNSSLRVIVSEPKNNLKANLVTLDGGFEMNADLIHFLENKPEIDVQVTAV